MNEDPMTEQEPWYPTIEPLPLFQEITDPLHPSGIPDESTRLDELEPEEAKQALEDGADDEMPASAVIDTGIKPARP